MGTFGKVLIVLNLLAAGAFVYLAAQSWGARNEWAAAAFRHELFIQGLPLQPPASPADVDEDFVPFDFAPNPAVRLTQVRKDTLQKYLPQGGPEFGGGALVTNVTDEVKRLHQKVTQDVTSPDGADKRRPVLLRYLLNLATTGTERDGLTALLRDLFDPRRRAEARRELPYLGKTPAQVAALGALLRLAELKDEIDIRKRDDGRENEKVAAAKRALADTARAALPGAVGPGTDEARAEELRKLVNPLTDILNANGETPDANRLAEAKKTLAAAGGGQSGALLATIAEIAGNPLASAQDVAAAREQLATLIQAQATTSGEKAAMAALVQLIGDPNAKIAEAAEAVGKGLLDARFEVAEAPAAETPTPGAVDPIEKRMAAAHLLYHIDAHLRWDQRAPWHQRVQAVLGMTDYVRAADAQATNLAAMAQRLKGEVTAEAAGFEADYQGLVQRVLYLSSQLDDVESRLADQRNLQAQHQQNLENRQAELADLRNEHKKTRDDAKKYLTDLRGQQQRLFEMNTRLRDTQDSLFKLEEELKVLEQKVNAAKSAKRLTRQN